MLIKIILPFTSITENILPLKVNLKKMDWDRYQKECPALIKPQLPFPDLDENIEYLTQAIITAIKISTPEVRRKSSGILVP